MFTLALNIFLDAFNLSNFILFFRYVKNTTYQYQSKIKFRIVDYKQYFNSIFKKTKLLRF